MVREFDIAIVGTGTSAHHVVHAAAPAGKRVVVIDELPYGGTCAMRGCQPKKYLVAAAAAALRAKHMAGIGIAGETRIDWAALQRNKDAFVDAVPEGTERGFVKAGAETMHGHAVFTGPDTLRVGDEEIRAGKFVVATGAIPRPLGIPGEELLTSSDEFLDLPTMPAGVIFVGGGYISFEFAFVARAAGAAVTILQKGPRPLKQFDPDIVDVLVEAARAEGITVTTGACVERVERPHGRLATSCGEHPGEFVEADLVVHGAGRVPNTADLGLPAAGVEFSPRGILVDEYLRSVSNPNVYAIGDVAATPFQLATTADVEGKTVAKNLLEGDRHTPDFAVVPSAAFTEPPIAAVGLSEAQARADGVPVRVKQGSMTGWPSSRRIGQKFAAYKTIVHEETDRILGAHLIGYGMDEAINVFALAIGQGLTATEFRETIWAYPTYGSDMKYTV